MEVENDENGKAPEASVNKIDQNAGRDGEVVVEAEGEAERDENEVVETFMDAEPEVGAIKVVAEENKTENGIIEEPSVLASVEASSSGMKKPQGLRPKTKVVKKVKRLLKRKIVKGTAIQVAGEKNVTVEQSAEPSLGEREKVIESVADSPQCKVKGTLAQGMDKESETISQGHKEGLNLNSIMSENKDAGAFPGENVIEAEKAIEDSVEAPENALLVEKKQPLKLKAKAELRKTPAAPLLRTEVDKGTPPFEQNDEQRNGVEKLNSLEVNTSEGDQQKTIAEKNKQNQLTEDKTGLAENKRRRRKRQGKQVLGSNKKQKPEVVTAADATQQRIEERKDQIVDPEKREKDGNGKVKIGGLIFMCNSKTRPDCFRFSVMGVQEKRKDYVIGIKPGLKLFLYDYDLKLLYGVFQASSAGGMKLERNAFGGSFPAQVRFKVFSDCIPLPESQFKKAIKENYNNKNKFKTELTHKQVFKLKKLFRPVPLPAQITHTQPVLIPRDADRKRSDKDRYAPDSSRTHLTDTHERRRNASPPPRREEPPRDLYLSEREYRTYGLRRGEPSQHYPIPPPDSSYHRVPVETYRPYLDHDRLLRHAEIERHHERSREVCHLHLPERDYHPYYLLSSRREIMARHSPDPLPPAVALDSYRRDPYYSYDYRAPERPPRTYLAASSREDDDLYSRYVTADSLAEYYRSSSSRRYPSIGESELPTSSIISRYAYSGSSPISHRR